MDADPATGTDATQTLTQWCNVPKPQPVRQQQQRAAEATAAPARPKALDHSRETDNALSFTSVNWRAALLAAGGLLVAVARRDYASAFTNLLALAEAFGITFARAEMSYTDPSGERRTVATVPAEMTEPKN